MFLRYTLLICLVAMPVLLPAQDKKAKPATVKVEKGSSLKIYPNPARTFANIFVEWPSVRNFTISIYDLDYKAVIKDWKVEARKSYEYSLDVIKLPRGGSYRVTVKSDGGELQQDFTIAR